MPYALEPAPGATAQAATHRSHARRPGGAAIASRQSLQSVSEARRMGEIAVSEPPLIDRLGPFGFRGTKVRRNGGSIRSELADIRTPALHSGIQMRAYSCCL